MAGTRKLRARLKPDTEADLVRANNNDDVERFVALLAYVGIEASADDVYEAWRRHSDSYAANWMVSYRDDDLDREALLRYFDLVELDDGSSTAVSSSG